MDQTELLGGLALSMQMGTAFYALRLNRIFGTARAGWSLFGAFALMLALHLSEAWSPNHPASGDLLPPFIYLVTSALLLIGLTHVDMLFRERLVAEQLIRRSRDELEDRVQERTQELLQANASLQTEIKERERTEREIRTAQARYQELVDSVDCIVFEAVGEDLHFSFVSPQCERLLGYSAERWLQMSWREIVHPDDLEMVFRTCQSSLQAMGKSTVEFRALAADGREIWLRQLINVIADKDRCAKLRGVLLDITERRSMEIQLRQAQRLESIGRLAGGVAHDFNNLLTIIQGHADFLLEDQVADPIRDSLREIQAASHRAGQLTAQLLAFGRGQAMQTQTVDLNQVIHGLLEMLRRIIGENIRLLCQFSSEPVLIQADTTLVEQVLMNLVVNARDATADGGELTLGTAVVTVAEEYLAEGVRFPKGRYVCLMVKDNGRGIAPDILPRIFEPFFTTKEFGKGSGLGLPTAYGIVRQHHGWIKVDSSLGRGTTFQVYLPNATEQLPAPVRAQTTNRQCGGETILLVEDEPGLRKMASRVLERHGYKVLEANSGVAALDVWKEHHDSIDLLLTDIVMPEAMNGWQLAEKLRSERPGLKVLHSSGYVPETLETDRPIQLLPKPYEVGQLLEAIRTVLDGGSMKVEG